jgi:hypothetical protein
MNVIDSPRATSASTLIVGGLAANVGLTVLFYVVSWVVPGSYEGLWPIVEQLLWLGAVGVLVTGLFQLAGAVTEGSLLRLAAGALIFDGLLDLAVTVFMRQLGGGLFGTLVNDFSLLLSLAARGLLIVAIIQLTMKTHAWVLPLLGMVAVVSVLRSALNAARWHQLIDYELFANPVYRFSLPVISLFNVGAMLVGGLALKAAIPTGPGIGTPALVAAAGLRPAVPEPISPASDFLVGGILLAVGIGVTVVSMEAASNGGRYIVATGAIGVGVGRIIRGFIRAARGA